MRLFIRAAAVAAAMLAVTSTAFASPSYAMDIASAPLAAHNLANFTADQQLPDTIVAPVLPQTDFSTPIAAEAPKPRSLVELVDHHLDTARVSDQEHECLAGAIYFESRGEPLEGQLAVADVVLNRAASGKYPQGVCEVITQKAQFSFIEDGQFPEPNKASKAWRKAVAVARVAQNELAEAVPEEVLWYHADYVAPVWRHGLKKSEKIGVHIFYGPKNARA
jgi:spore germination cell wall hydrolase CwlJ-like protein